MFVHLPPTSMVSFPATFSFTVLQPCCLSLPGIHFLSHLRALAFFLFPAACTFCPSTISFRSQLKGCYLRKPASHILSKQWTPAPVVLLFSIAVSFISYLTFSQIAVNYMFTRLPSISPHLLSVIPTRRARPRGRRISNS